LYDSSDHIYFDFVFNQHDLKKFGIIRFHSPLAANHEPISLPLKIAIYPWAPCPDPRFINRNVDPAPLAPYNPQVPMTFIEGGYFIP